MEVITLQDDQDEALEKAEAIIRKGGFIAVPTDTIYGIIGDATNENAVEALYELKQRPKEKAFPIFIRDIAMARWFAYISDAKARFLENAWPGTMTVIFNHKEKLTRNLTVGKDTVALRMPDTPFLLALLARMNVPLVQSSANISGIVPAKNTQEIIASFEGRAHSPDLIIDGGELAGSPSVIIDFTGNKPLLVRSGLMNKNDIDALCEKLVMIEDGSLLMRKW